MSWRLAESLKTLRAQLNTLFPNRSKVSDGSIGNEEHSARTSDHNPNERGVVCAIDITFDDNPSDGIGVDCQKLADALVASRDSRIKYIIWNRQICSSKQQPWKWRAYTGTNAHKHHLHISADASLYDDAKEWKLDFNTTSSKPGATPDLKIGDEGDAVRILQDRLVSLMYLKEADGLFGEWTRKAVMAFQADKKLRADGIVGKNTRAELNL